MTEPRRYTAADLEALPPDGKRYEIIRGELLVTPAPGGRHQPIKTVLVMELGSYLHANGLLRDLLTAPSDVHFAEDTVVEPDVLVADTSKFLATGDWRDITTVHLIIEIISPSSRLTDPGIKRELYQEHDVPTYWIVDPDEREVQVFTARGRFPIVCTSEVRWRHPALDDECVIDLGRLFDLR